MQYERLMLISIWILLFTRKITNQTYDSGRKNRHRGGNDNRRSGSHRSPVVGQQRLHEQEVIKRVLGDYDWRVRPRGTNQSNVETGGPVVVTVNIYLRSISKIDDVNMEYSAQFTFREIWVDDRLAYRKFLDAPADLPDAELQPRFVVLTTTDMDQQIWMPDTFFQNEKQAQKHNIDKPNVMIRIYPNGKILYSVRNIAENIVNLRNQHGRYLCTTLQIICEEFL